MKEILDIIEAYTTAAEAGKRMALATVVHVDGSSYRRPGARMLVTDDGILTGAISGGCLEGDALRKALLVINQQQNKLVTYDTRDEDDARFGVQLGCNGIVHILFEPIDTSVAVHPIILLQQLAAERREGVLVTLFSLNKPQEAVPGTCLLALPDMLTATQHERPFDPMILQEVQHALHHKQTFIKSYPAAAGEITAFVEFVTPPVALMIVGAGNDALPMADMAAILGWQVTVIDGRVSHASPQRFPNVNRIIVAKPEQVLAQLEVDAQTVFILMTHNYNYDLHLLRLLLEQTDCLYIGSLGPKKKLERMIDNLAAQGLILTASQMNRVFGPVGLDLGAETAAEIALAVIAEIKKVLEGRSGDSLREKKEPIHHTAFSEISFSHGHIQ